MSVNLTLRRLIDAAAARPLAAFGRLIRASASASHSRDPSSSAALCAVSEGFSLVTPATLAQ